MTIHKTTSIQTKLVGPDRGTTEVKVDGNKKNFQLDGQLESFVPSHQSGDVRSLQEAADLVAQPKVQKVLQRIRSSNSMGAKVELENSGTWDVYPMFGTVSISRLNPEDGHRHRVQVSRGTLGVYQETMVGGDTVKQEIRADFDQQTGAFQLQEEWLTVDSVAMSQ